MGALLTYALNSEGQRVHIDEVKQGGACNCHCPYCNSPLYAKNGGEIREHHFAHAHDHHCEATDETELHRLAKQIIDEEGGVMLPSSEHSNKPSGYVQLKNIEVEKWDETLQIRPDLEGTMCDGKKLLIEILVSHKVGSKKYDIITANDLLCVEIDCNCFELNKDELREYLTKDTAGRKWIEKKTEKQPTDGIGSVYCKDPLFDKLRDMIKAAFDNKSFSIHLPHYLKSHLSENFWDEGESDTYNLSDYDYDTCVVDATYRGFKSDLLLYRSGNPYKGYISINFRAKLRSKDFCPPCNLRMIDVILRDKNDEYIEYWFSEGVLRRDMFNVEFKGIWKFQKTLY